MGNQTSSGARSRRAQKTDPRSSSSSGAAQQEYDPYVGGTAQPDPFADHPNYRGGSSGNGAAAAGPAAAPLPGTSAARQSARKSAPAGAAAPGSGAAAPRSSAGEPRGSRTRTENRDSRNRAREREQQRTSGATKPRSRSPTAQAQAATTARTSRSSGARQSRSSAQPAGAAGAAVVPAQNPTPPSPRERKSRTSTSSGRSSQPPRATSSGAAYASGPGTSDGGTNDGKMFSRRDKMKKKEEMSAESAKLFVSTQSVKASDIPQPDASSGKSFDELYRLKEVLGTGAFSTVREGYHRRYRDRMFAVKCVNRAKLTEEDAAALLDEVAILKELRHAHIIRLYDFFEEPGNYYLVMEKMTGGELFDRVVAKAYYNEKEARDTCRIILEAVGYCHRHSIAHRDLKPENLLLVSDDNDSAVKIADFGFAKKVLSPKSLSTQCGTPGYVAPEILEGTPYDTKADMWSVGVILYILLGGYPPFIENNQRELFRKIRRGDYEFHEEYWGSVSADAKGLISSLLTVDPAKRLDAKQALRAPWMIEDDTTLANHDLGTNLNELRKFNGKRKFRAAVSTVMAANKLQSLGKDFLRNLD